MADDAGMAGVLGVFADPSAAARAVREARDQGFGDVRAAMPAAFKEVSEALGRGESRIGRITLAGAATGTAFGFALCAGASLSWPLITGGKPIVSIPPFIVIAFELSVLVGALANLTSLVIAARRKRRARRVPDDPRFATNRIGVFVVGGDAALATRILQENGAEEVRRAG